LTVLDVEEGTHVQFSYDKYLGLRPLSERDEENRNQGKETTVERTRRLFYVCCTRAMKDLVVVLFTANPAVAKDRILALKLFPPDAIVLF
jgi:DNA helicase-2/ATP-dependent DNA helicase PcrA